MYNHRTIILGIVLLGFTAAGCTFSSAAKNWNQAELAAEGANTFRWYKPWSW